MQLLQIHALPLALPLLCHRRSGHGLVTRLPALDVLVARTEEQAMAPVAGRVMVIEQPTAMLVLAVTVLQMLLTARVRVLQMLHSMVTADQQQAAAQSATRHSAVRGLCEASLHYQDMHLPAQVLVAGGCNGVLWVPHRRPSVQLRLPQLQAFAACCCIRCRQRLALQWTLLHIRLHLAPSMRVFRPCTCTTSRMRTRTTTTMMTAIMVPTELLLMQHVVEVRMVAAVQRRQVTASLASCATQMPMPMPMLTV